MISADIESAVQEIISEKSVIGVIGSPNSGKTTAMCAAVKVILEENPGARIAVLHPSRRVAGRLRNRLSREIGGLSTGVSVQSINAFAFSILSADAQEQGRELPKLVTGPELDTIIREILADSGNKIFTNSAQTQLKFDWLASDIELSEIIDNSALRTEFRELITRAAELGLGANLLERLADEFKQPVWADGARMIRAYERALATAESVDSKAPQNFDHARIINAAANVLKRKYQDISESLITDAANSDWHWDWIFIDDLQNATLSTKNLLKVLQLEGSRIRYFANPDQGVESYRGGMVWLPKILSRPQAQSGLEAEIIKLTAAEVRGEQYSKFLQRLVSGIYPVGFGSQRKITPSAESIEQVGTVTKELTPSAYLFHSEAERIRYVADFIQKIQSEGQATLADIAIITRGTSNHRNLVDSFSELGVRLQSDSIKRPLREIPIIRSLIQLIFLAQKFNTSSTAVLKEMPVGENWVETFQQLFAGTIFQLPSRQIELIRRQVWSYFVVKGNCVDEQDFWEKFFNRKIAKEELADFPELLRLLSMLETISSELASPQESIFSLWNIWQILDLAESLQEQALGSDMQLAKAANESLDAMIQLFAIAERMSQRSSQPVTLLEVIERVLEQDLGEDTVARLGSAVDAVTLITPTNSVGLHWKHVIIWDLEEGVWPNLRLRNPISHVPELCSVILEKTLGAHEIGASQSHQEVMSDELRMLLQAVTRGLETLTLTSVTSEGVNPSAFFDFLVAQADEIKAGQIRLQQPKMADLIRDPLMVLGQMRKLKNLQDLSGKNEAQLENYVQRLLQLVSFKVTPKFIDELEISSNTPLFSGEVRLSPSRYHSWKQCSLRQTLDMFVGNGTANQFSLNLGNVVHRFAETYPRGASGAEVEAWFRKYWDLISYGADKFEVAEREELLRKVLRLCNEYLSGRKIESWAETKATYRKPEDFKITAFADRIEYNPDSDELKIIDFKTSKKAPAKVEIAEHGQLSMYQFLARKGAFSEIPISHIPEKISAELINVRELQKIKIQAQEELSEQQLEALEENLSLMSESLRGSEFIPNPGTHCRSCAYSAMCPARDGKLVYSR